MAVSIVMVVKLWLYQFSAKINMSRNSPVLSREYSSTFSGVLQYFGGSTPVLPWKYCGTLLEVLVRFHGLLRQSYQLESSSYVSN